MLRVDQVHVIRHKVLVEGRSQRQVAKEFGISRVTVRKYVEEAVPVRKETAPRVRPVCGPRRRGRSRADADKYRTISEMRASRVMHTPSGRTQMFGAHFEPTEGSSPRGGWDFG